MSVIPFPVCEYAAILYKDGRRLGKTENCIGGRQLRMKKQNEIK